MVKYFENNQKQLRFYVKSPYTQEKKEIKENRLSCVTIRDFENVFVGQYYVI